MKFEKLSSCVSVFSIGVEDSVSMEVSKFSEFRSLHEVIETNIKRLAIISLIEFFMRFLLYQVCCENIEIRLYITVIKNYKLF